MSKLSFNLAALLPLLDHAAAAPTCRPTFAQLFDKNLWKKEAKPTAGGWVDQADIDASKVPAQLFLVKDSGCYLMSAGDPGLPAAIGSQRSAVVYAKNCDPEKDADCYDTCRRLCGGDDFSEALPLTMFREAISEGKADAKQLVVTLLKRSIRMQTM